MDLAAQTNIEHTINQDIQIMVNESRAQSTRESQQNKNKEKYREQPAATRERKLR